MSAKPDKIMADREKPPTPGLYLVATPIGNLRDISLRALDVLGAADAIACEDKRVTAKLLAAFGIRTPLVTYHEHNAARARPRLVARLEGGETIALVSDAGTPLISDPGYKLVGAAREKNIPVHALPGASAVLAALASSGQPSDAFHFAGFLPSKKSARASALQSLAVIPATLILFESARRLPAMLQDACEILGPRPASVCRELTKLHEEILAGTLDTLAARYAADGPPRGEIVVVIGGGGEARVVDDDEIDRRLASALETESLRDAARTVAAATGAGRGRVYARALALADRKKTPS